MGNLTSGKGCNNPFFKGSTRGTDFSENINKSFSKSFKLLLEVWIIIFLSATWIEEFVQVRPVLKNICVNGSLPGRIKHFLPNWEKLKSDKNTLDIVQNLKLGILEKQLKRFVRIIQNITKLKAFHGKTIPSARIFWYSSSQGNQEIRKVLKFLRLSLGWHPASHLFIKLLKIKIWNS